MGNKAVVGIIALLVGVGGTIAVQKMAVQPDERVNAHATKGRDLSGELARKELEIKQLRHALAEATKVDAKVIYKTGDDIDDVLGEYTIEPTAEEKEAEPNNPLKALTDLAANFSNSEFREKLDKNQRVMNEERIFKEYADFVSLMNMSDTEADAFMQVVVNNQQSPFDFLSMVGKGEQFNMEKFQAEQGERKTRTDADLKKVLGTDRFAAYENYTNTLGERQKLKGFEDKLLLNDLKLNGDQREAMVSVYADNADKKTNTRRQQFPGMNRGGAPMFKLMGEGEEADTRRADYLAKEEARDQAVLEGSRDVLRPGQQEALQNHFAKEQQDRAARVRTMANSGNIFSGFSGNGAPRTGIETKVVPRGDE